MYFIDFIWYLIDIITMFDKENNTIRSVKINLKKFAPQSTLKLNLQL
jgi:hypothetical protein